MGHQGEEAVGTARLGEEDFTAEEAGGVVVADIEEEGVGIVALLAVVEAGEVVMVHQEANLMAFVEAHLEVVEDLIKDHEVDFRAVELIKMAHHLLDHKNLKNTVIGFFGGLAIQGHTSKILKRRR